MSSFRLICIAALTVAMVGSGAATAQNAAATDQSGKPYLAGLRPRHAHDKPAQKTSHAGPRHKPTKMARPETKRRPAAGATAKAHRSTRLADKINSRVAWPRVEPAAADERATAETVLQFATEETGSTPAAAPRPMTPAPAISAPKITSPPKIAATDERDNTESNNVDQTPPTAGTLVQTERFEAPASSEMRVILPAQSEAPVTTPLSKDLPSARSNSAIAPMLATLAGAITAGIAGWLMIGFASGRTIKSRHI